MSTTLTAEEIRPGDVILGRVLLDEHGQESTKPIRGKARPVKTVGECPGAWRSHVHLDGGCWWNGTRLAVQPAHRSPA